MTQPLPKTAPRLRPQFSLRAALLAMTLVAVYLGWRFQGSPEADAVAAIQAAGGRVHFHYQEPSPSFTFISVGMLPGHTYLGQVDVQVNGATSPPPPTLLEHLMGTDNDLTVHTVEIPLTTLTPQLAARFQSLRHLERIILTMPDAILPDNSPAASRLKALQAEFPDKIFPAFQLPF